MELVTASGGLQYGKLGVLQRSLNPVVMTAVPLPDAQAVWTVFGPTAKGADEDMEEDGNEEGEESAGMHAYMVISQGNDKGTIVLKGRELEEFDEDEQVDFEVDAKTVCVGNIFGNQRIVQVCSALLYCCPILTD